MSDPRIPTDIGTQLRRLEERLARLERAAVTGRGQSAIRGTLTVMDADGTPVAVIGELPAVDRAGIMAGLDPDGTSGTTFLSVVDFGLAYPYLGSSWARADEFYGTTSASFVQAYSTRVEMVSYPNFRCVVPVNADVGTSGEVRIVHTSSGSATSTFAFGSAGGNPEFKWDVSGFIDAGTGPVIFQVQARRTAGAGSVRVWNPSTPTMGKISSATVTGL